MCLSRFPYKHVVAAIFVAALFLDLLDMTITNVALPALEREFGGSPARLQWVTTAYLLALAVITPVSGWIGDRFGTKRVFLAALIIFTAASGLCAAAWSLESLIAFRAVQGAGGGLLTPVGMAMLLRAYPRDERASASAVIAVPAAVAPALGPVLGGYIVDTYTWHWAFLINVPVGIASVAFAARMLREESLLPAGRLDLRGFVLGATGLAVTLYALAQIGERGSQDAAALTLGVVGAGLLAAFVWAERRAITPMIDLRLFRDRAFGSGNAVMFMAAAAFAATLFLLPLLLQMTRGLSAFNAGLITAAHAVGILVVMPFVPRMYNRIGARGLSVAGMLGMATATTGFLFVDLGTSSWTLVAIMFANGLAYGLTIVALQTAPFAALAGSQMGQATAAFNVVRQVALSVGVALIATLLSVRLLAHEAVLGVVATARGGVDAFHEAFVLVVVLHLVGTGVALLMPAGKADAEHWSGRKDSEPPSIVH